VWACFQRWTWLLQEAAGFAPRGGQTCYQRSPALLPICVEAATKVYQSCGQGVAVLLPAAAGAATMALRHLLPWRGGVAASGRRGCYHGDAALLP
jgi:hypothetical protein